MSFINKLWVKLFYKKVGEDQYGNQYFLGRCKNSVGKTKRYVYYKGLDESTKIPPMWHAWLHYLIDEMPAEQQEFDWQQDYKPNLTGTPHAYDPRCKKEDRVYYQAWKPKI